MRKLTIALGITALSIGAAAQAAPEAGGYCVDFDFFCDGLQFVVGQDGKVAGEWVNSDCAGTNVPGLRGNTLNPTLNIWCDARSIPCPGGLTWLFKLEQASSTFDMYGWDGVNPPFLQQFNSPYSLSQGQCSFSDGNFGLPSSLAR